MNSNLSTRLDKTERELHSVTESAEKYAVMLQKTKLGSETPRPDWISIFETVLPQIIEHKIPGIVVTGTSMKDGDYRGSTCDKVQVLCELLCRMLPSEYLPPLKPEISSLQFFEPLGMGRSVTFGVCVCNAVSECWCPKPP